MSPLYVCLFSVGQVLQVCWWSEVPIVINVVRPGTYSMRDKFMAFTGSWSKMQSVQMSAHPGCAWACYYSNRTFIKHFSVQRDLRPSGKIISLERSHICDECQLESVKKFRQEHHHNHKHMTPGTYRIVNLRGFQVTLRSN